MTTIPGKRRADRCDMPHPSRQGLKCHRLKDHAGDHEGLAHGRALPVMWSDQAYLNPDAHGSARADALSPDTFVPAQIMDRACEVATAAAGWSSPGDVPTVRTLTDSLAVIREARRQARLEQDRRTSREWEEDQAQATDERLTWMLHVLGAEFGPLGVIRAAGKRWPDAAEAAGYARGYGEAPADMIAVDAADDVIRCGDRHAWTEAASDPAVSECTSPLGRDGWHRDDVRGGCWPAACGDTVGCELPAGHPEPHKAGGMVWR